MAGFELTQADVRDAVSYNAATGEFRAVRRGGSPGRVLNRVLGGRVTVKLFGVRFWADRLAWFWSYGAWPCGPVWRANKDWLDLRLANIRVGKGTFRQHLTVDCALGARGVKWSRRDGMWQASVRADGHRVALGLFKNIGDAIEAVQAAKADRDAPDA